MTSNDESEKQLASLPKGDGWGLDDNLCLYQDFWFYSAQLKGVTEFQRDFKAFDSDILLSTLPKSGTIWLKSMAFAIVNRARYLVSSEKHPLLTTSPHDLVRNIEYFHSFGAYSSLSDFVSSEYSNENSRLLATHMPYHSLPESLKSDTNNSRIVYLCRNPKDNFISLWNYLNRRGANIKNPFPIEIAFELFCNGVSLFGPVWENVLGYWKASLENPKKVLFLKYEDLKQEPKSHVKMLAEFLGFPFSEEEERGQVIEDILKLSSFEFMKSLSMNKDGSIGLGIENKIFFRKGEVGDWKNQLTTSMVERIDSLFEEKLQGSGLVFES
ncbi:hypothetical protein MKW94_025021 [Papaver nudicaule]|uniref:Sulfotransferase n=1 Tax=Papaver nudicaule TaxID=74823 RepID=A0AA42B4L7_PAPNU|nr:hypothetical protein [Papaver nudicaule]